MRQKKFRVWDGKKMYMPFDLHEALTNSEEGGSFPSDSTFLEWTGLKDCKGVEIWEDDIIKWDSGEIEQVMHSNNWDGRINSNIAPFMSSWGSTCGKYYRTFMNIYDPSRFATVIGNKFQHPDLLTNSANQQTTLI